MASRRKDTAATPLAATEDAWRESSDLLGSPCVAADHQPCTGLEKGDGMSTSPVKKQQDEGPTGEEDQSSGRPEALHATEEVPPAFRCPRLPLMVVVLLMFAALTQSFASTCISLFINMDLGFGPVEVTRYWMYVGYTSWFQPLLGAASDLFVIFHEKRRPLFILCAVGNTIIYSIFCFKSESTNSFAVFVVVSIIANVCTMGIYIPLNGILVEVGRTDGETQEESISRVSAIMSKAMVFRSVGSLVGTVLHTCLVIKLSVHTMLGVSAILFAIHLPLVLVTPRKLFLKVAARQDNFYKGVRKTCSIVKESFNIKDYRSDGVCFVLVLVFVFLYCLMPDAQSVYYNYLYGAFWFDAWFYSMNNCIGYLGSIAGAYVFSLWMDYRAKKEHEKRGVRTSIFFIFTIGCLAWAFGYVTNLLLCTGFIVDVLHIPAEVYVPIDNFFMSLFVRFAFMPTIVMAAEHAPKNFEATAFEVFSVASMGGGTVSSLITSFIAEGLNITRTNYDPLWILLVISIACKLVPIPLAYLLPERHHTDDTADLLPSNRDAGLLIPEEGFCIDVVDKAGDRGGAKHLRCEEDCHNTPGSAPVVGREELPDEPIASADAGTNRGGRHRAAKGGMNLDEVEYPNTLRQ